MKKKLSLFFTLLLSMGLVVGCNQQPDDPKKDDPVEDPDKKDDQKDDDQKDPEPVIEYWSVKFEQGNYKDLSLYKDQALKEAITDNKVEKGKDLYFKFTISDTTKWEFDKVTFNEGAASTISEIANTEATYTYKVAGVKADITLTIATKEVTPVTPPPATEDGYKVEFELKEHVKDLKVYKKDTRTAADVDSGSTFYSRDSASGEAIKDGTGQINFEFKLDSGYQLKGMSATEGTYKNIKFLGVKNGVVLARVTKITADTKITIEAEATSTVHEGYTVTLVKSEHVKSITLYTNCGFTEGTEITGLVTKSIDESNGNPTKDKGRVYFTVEMEAGWDFDSLVFDPTDSKAEADVDEDIENSHIIKKINKDLTVSIKAKEGELPEEGFDVSFTLVNIEGNSWNGQSHLKNLAVYTDQTLATADEGETTGSSWSQKTVYKTRNGDTGKMTKVDGQVNFTIEADEGYQIKSITATAGAYKNIKFVAGKSGAKDSYRITKITSDLTVSITAEAVTAGWPVSIEGVGDVKVFSDATFATEVTNENKFLAKDATGNPTKESGTLYVQVAAAHGYKLGTAAPAVGIDGAAKIEAVTIAGKENCYKISKIVHATPITFTCERDAVNVPYLYYKSTTKANTYTSGEHIAQSGDTYFVVGADSSFCVVVWFWTYDGDATKEEINIKIPFSYSAGVMNCNVGDPLAQFNNGGTDRKEWQHVSNKSFPVEEITAAEFPTEFTYYLALFQTTSL